MESSTEAFLLTSQRNHAQMARFDCQSLKSQLSADRFDSGEFIPGAEQEDAW